MTGAILTNTVPATTITSASRGVCRITSAPKRAISCLLVRLVIISTKQQEVPNPKGQREFFRPQASRSVTRERMNPGRPLPSFISIRDSPPAPPARAPVQSPHAPHIHQSQEQHEDEEHDFEIADPPQLAHRHGP